MGKLEKDLAGKVKLLNFPKKKTSDILKKRDAVAIERQREALVSITASIDTIKRELVGTRFERGDNEETVTSWSKEVENQVDEVDVEIEHLQ